MIAALLALPEVRWRSRQFSATLSLPLSNHLAWGNFQLSTFRNGRRQARSSLACRPQNFSGVLTDSAYILLYKASLPRLAWALNSAEGLTTRVSREIEVIVWSVTSWLIEGLRTLERRSTILR